MKRALFDTVKVLPYTAGDPIDRKGFLSARLALLASAAGALTLDIEHSDEEAGTYEAVADPFLLLDSPPAVLAVDDLVNVNIDLEGCKRFITITPNRAGDCAIALGDPARAPV